MTTNSREEFLDLLDKTVSPEYLQDVRGTPSYATFRALADIFSKLSIKARRTFQARYYLPHANQTDLPASGPVKAELSITLVRTGNLNEPLDARPGEMRLAVHGRTYANKERIVWEQRDESDIERTAIFECEVPGFPGDVSHVADDDGIIDIERKFDFAEVGGSSGNRATIFHHANKAWIQDSGVPDVFVVENVGLYVEITGSTAAENITKIFKIVGFEAQGVEIPPGSGKYPRTVIVSETKRAIAGEAYSEDFPGPSRTDLTDEVNDDVDDDVPLLPSTINQNDALVIMSAFEIAGVDVQISTAGEGSYELAWEYWDGSAWAELANVSDLTSGFQSVGWWSVTWDVPTFGSFTSLSSGDVWASAVRVRVSSATPTLTEQPLAARVVVLRREPISDDVGGCSWAVRSWEQLGVEITAASVETIGRDDDLWVLGDNRGVYRQPNESDETFRQRAARLHDVVSPNAIQRIVNRALAPHNVDGLAIDVQNGFTGFFLDLDPDLALTGDGGPIGALDMYEDGDAYPLNPFMLILSRREAYLHFFVVVPYLGLGDFGIGLDDGPITRDDLHDVYIGSAADSGFLDGYPVGAYALYAGIWSAVDRARATPFTLIRSTEI